MSPKCPASQSNGNLDDDSLAEPLSRTVCQNNRFGLDVKTIDEIENDVFNKEYDFPPVEPVHISSLMSSMKRAVDQLAQVDVVVIGGGPVGLWTAIQVRILDPTAAIVVFEKHAVYQRRHVVRISSYCLSRGIPYHHELSKLVRSLPRYIRTSDLEDQLLRLAIQLGVLVVQEAIGSVEELIRRFPNVRIVVGADGAHSTTRKQIFGIDMAYHEVLHYVAELKYEVVGEGKRLGMINQAYPTLKIMDHLASEFVGKTTRQEDGRVTSPVTLRLNIKRHEYFLIKDATFKRPLMMRNPAAAQISPRMLTSMRIWLNAKKLLVNEQMVAGSERLSTTVLSVYHAAEYSCVKEERLFAVVGDAAFGVPFFRSLNNGIMCGTVLARDICAFLAGRRDGLEYCEFADHLARSEIKEAKAFNDSLTFAKFMLKVNGWVPWQLIFWSSQKTAWLKQNDPFASDEHANVEVAGDTRPKKSGDERVAS